MAQHGKMYRDALAQVDREALYGVSEAIDIVKRLSRPTFDETVELAVRLGVDPRKADQIVRGTLVAPGGDRPHRARRCLRRRRAGDRGPGGRRRRRGRR